MFQDNAANLPKAKTPKERQDRIENASKLKSEYNNPCLKEQKLVYKCLGDNNYDKTICEPVFVNYNVCQKFWNEVKKDRRMNSIRPELPWPEDRERIKAEYFKKKGL